MQICDACKSLAGASVRLVKPTHLQPLPTNLTRAGAQPAGMAYRCETCDSRWYWGVSGSWVLWLPVAAATREREKERLWWRSITEAISRWRTVRRLRSLRAWPRSVGIRHGRIQRKS